MLSKIFYTCLCFYIIFMLNFTCYAEQDFYLSAKKIIKNDKENIILAQDSVEVQYNKIKLSADTLTFNTKKNEITLEGNVKILYVDGSTVFADRAILNKNLNAGIIRNLGVLMSDESRLVASSAKKESNKYRTVYRNISYTRCDNCEDQKGTFWKINAKKATHLEKSKIILYEDVFFEILNQPILYFPFFYHPDPSVNRKTGLLTPSFSSSNIFGLSYEQPFFLNLSSRSDLTLSTKFTEKEGLLLKNSYRSNSSSGQLRFNSSLTRGTKVRVNEISKKENRGHIDLNFANKIYNDITIGGNIKRASDKSYLSKYEISDGETLLTQNLFFDRDKIFTKFSGEIFKFQSLSDDYLEDNLPFVRPVLVYSWNNLWDSKRDRINTTSVKLKSISKKNNNSVNAIYFFNNSHKSYLINNVLLKNDIDFDLDFYKSKVDDSNNNNIFRFFPSISLTASYPQVKLKKKKSILVEPITQFIYTRDDNKTAKIRNEDSLETELVSSNLFTKNKYYGDDRKEHGFRINYGFKIKSNNTNGTSESFMFGRSYYEKKQEQFDSYSGFKGRYSDFVGNYTLYFSEDSKLYYDFRTSDDLDLNRNRLKTDFKIYDSKININYIQIKNFASRSNSDTEQISYQFEKELFKNWSFSFSQNRDLAGASFSTPFKSTFGVIFENDCSLISFEVTRDKSYDVDIPSTTNYNFKINLF